MRSSCRVAFSMCMHSTYADISSQWKAASTVLGLTCDTGKRYMHRDAIGRATTTTHSPLYRRAEQQRGILDRYERITGTSAHAQLAWSSHARLAIATAASAEPSAPIDSASADSLRLTQAGQRIEVCTDDLWVWDVKVSPDGKQFATASDFLRLWDTATGSQERRCDVPSEPNDTYSSSWQVYSVCLLYTSDAADE